MNDNRLLASMGAYIAVLACIIGTVGCTSRAPSTLADAISVRNPQWSPLGQYLVAECSFGGGEFLDYEICFIEPDLTALWRPEERYTVNHWSLLERWSPQGTQVAYRSEDGLIVVKVPSGESQRILTAPCADPAWSLSGTRIACAVWASGGSHEGDIVVVDLEPSLYSRLTTTDRDSSAVWVKSDNSLVFFRSSESDYSLYEIDTASAVERLLLSGLEPYLPTLSVSPDGEAVGYSNALGDSLEILELDTLRRESLVTPDNTCVKLVAYPQWSVDGRFIAFVAEAQSPKDDTIGAIWIVDVNGKELYQVSNVELVASSAISPPSWSPDSGTIVASFRGEVRLLDVSTRLSSAISCN